ncbi:oxalate decarboxylase [Methylosinus sp. R-45379]|uniref:cupin domain-containing protein n=1 Tax=unclassified Methylosinus TaxID=2624500 RepID=UPI0004650D5A|nr:MULTISPECIES: cupin domain-containing protein [unclassified Methylosinus]OAI23742.1 oxalate decarboxylase [Methylosinus sp. R-45379]TDX60808.1 oxalate decarboxylase [Methylosinus sp. sav-2]
MFKSRRDFLGSAALASGLVTFSSVAEATDKYLAKAGDGGFGRQAVGLPPGDAVAYHDPKEVAAMPDFKFSLDGNKPKVTSGGWAKEATVHQFPISKGIAGVHMYLEPGASRELHWHAIAAEWAFVIEGRCQTVVIEPSGASEINNFEPGDLWYFAKGHGHSIQTVGDKPCHFILSFDNGAFSEHGTFSITDWIDVTPKEMLGLEFGLPKDLFDAFPKGEAYIQSGPILKASDALEAPWPKESTHKFRLLRDPKAARDFDGGSFRLATIDEFPAQKTMSGGIMTLPRNGLRKLHWNVNANEWHYYLKGRGQVAIFGSGGRGKVAEFGPGDVAYIPQGFGHAIRNIGDEDLEIIQTWDNPKFEEIDLDKWVQSSPRYLLGNNFTGVPEATISQLKRG